MTESILSPLIAAGETSPWIPTGLFVALAVFSVGSAFVAALAPRIVHAVFGLMGAFLGVAGLYALLGADFVALVQVMVYVGGILVLLVFAILLTQRVRGRFEPEGQGKLLYPVLAGVAVFVGLLFALRGTDWKALDAPPPPEPTTAELGRALLDPQRYLVPFELASVLLLAALIGAAYLVRRRRDA